MGVDYRTTRLAEGVSSSASESVGATAIRLRQQRPVLGRVLRRLLADDVVVRVGFPPLTLHYEEYDEGRHAQRKGFREAAKRLLLRTQTGRRLRM